MSAPPRRSTRPSAFGALAFAMLCAVADSRAQAPTIALLVDQPQTLHVDGRGEMEVRLEGPFTLLGQTRNATGLDVRVQASAIGGGVLHVRDTDGARPLALRALALRLEREGRPVEDALSVSRGVPNDAGLPRSPRAERAEDPEAFRIVVDGAASNLARMRRLEPVTGVPTDERNVVLHDTPHGRVSAFFRLVADARDAQAPDVGSQLLRVALGDVVEVEIDGLTRQWPVGLPGDATGPRARRRARVRAHVVRWRGIPAVGGSDEAARQLVRDEIAIANALYAPCHVDFGVARDVDVFVVDAPPPTLLGVADGDGLPASGGTVRLRANGRRISVSIPTGSSAVDTAERIAGALRRAGFRARVTTNPRTRGGAGPSADVHVRDASGELVELSADGDAPLTTDARQRLHLGVVNLDDGLDGFEDHDARAGRLEERALIHALADDDPTTIELVIVPDFARRERRGEAFIPSDGSAVASALVVDREGLLESRSAYTVAHELGHVLLDLPFHPDELSEASPTRLLSSRGSDATVRGPKRLTADECTRLRTRGERHGLLRPAP
ncbi:MAG: hypothetical protein H6724_07750 [Sandaracinus sp.]|nr:hypothetical protein [Sandaracinus sp.]